MILDEAHEPVLVSDVSGQMPVHRGGAVVEEPVVEALVVAVVEALLLERVLEIPVGLGQEDEVGAALPHGPDHGRPVVLLRPLARPTAPGALEDVVHHQHRHIAADTVALLGDPTERVDHRAAQVSRERVQLDDIGPCWEVRVTTVREHAVSDLHE